jgi:hypothetical protein
VPLVHRQPVPVPRRQIPPRAPRPGPEQDPVHHRAVISPPPAPARIRRHQALEPRPMLIRKIMPVMHDRRIYAHPDPRSKKHALGPYLGPAPLSMLVLRAEGGLRGGRFPWRTAGFLDGRRGRHRQRHQGTPGAPALGDGAGPSGLDPLTRRACPAGGHHVRWDGRRVSGRLPRGRAPDLRARRPAADDE